tara:strand:+ start:1033 stop:1329 length:297 start_codon:yes stop_codon:yes gene_type:complete
MHVSGGRCHNGGKHRYNRPYSTVIIAPFHRYTPPDTAVLIRAGFLACDNNFRLPGKTRWSLKIMVAYSCGGSYGMGKNYGTVFPFIQVSPDHHDQPTA